MKDSTKAELPGSAKTKHPFYSRWIAMMCRCYDPKHRSWHNYGARGIKVCDRWRKSVSAFAEDMGMPPSPQHQIDRINNEGDYEPTNCRWVTASQNLRNRRGGVTISELRRLLARMCRITEANYPELMPTEVRLWWQENQQ